MQFQFIRFLNRNIINIQQRKFSDIPNFLQNLTKSEKEIVFDVFHPSKIGFLGLNRPKSKNALGKSFLDDFESVIKSLYEIKDIRCAIIGSLVPNIFCAGADLKERKQLSDNDVEFFVKKVRNLFQLLSDLPIPTICAIDGPALGGGLELALACDLRYASDNSYMGLVETRLAIIPGAGGTQRLPRLVGIAKAKEMMFTAKTVTGSEALEIGLVNGIVKQNADGNGAILHSFAIGGAITNNGPIGIQMVKAAVDEGILMTSVKEALRIEEKCYAKVIPTKDRLEGLLAFQDKRKPKYEGK